MSRRYSQSALSKAELEHELRLVRIKLQSALYVNGTFENQVDSQKATITVLIDYILSGLKEAAGSFWPDSEMADSKLMGPEETQKTILSLLLYNTREEYRKLIASMADPLENINRANIVRELAEWSLVARFLEKKLVSLQTPQGNLVKET